MQVGMIGLGRMGANMVRRLMWGDHECVAAAALARDPTLERFTGRASDSGEGRWTLDAAMDEAVPAHVLAAALFERFSSRGDFQDRLRSAMRFEFGGHVEKGSET
jgi:6-phosphogluconate dehydrogenase